MSIVKGQIPITLVLILALAVTANGNTRHLRLGGAYSMALLDNSDMDDNIRKMGLSAVTYSGHNADIQVFIGTDITERLTIGTSLLALTRADLSGSRVDTIEVGTDQNVASDLSILERHFRFGYFITGRYKITQTHNTVLEMCASVGQIDNKIDFIITRVLNGTWYSGAYPTWHKKSLAGLMQINAGFIASKGFSLFVTFGYLLSPKVTFEEGMINEISFEGTNIRDFKMSEHEIDNTHFYLLLGIEISPF